jgi:hypothetical protein
MEARRDRTHNEDETAGYDVEADVKTGTEARLDHDQEAEGDLRAEADGSIEVENENENEEEKPGLWDRMTSIFE